MSQKALNFHIDINVLNHLGIGLYSSTPAVVTEIISNAWDADAKNVVITVDPDADVIRVDDDGHGMTHAEVQNKFLCVGYSRRKREQQGSYSQSGNRRVMGRKGIGKLAMFSLARHISVVSRAAGEEAVAFEIDVQELKNRIEGHVSGQGGETQTATMAGQVPQDGSTGGASATGEEGDRRSADYPVKQVAVPADFTQAYGTRIILTGLNNKINKTAAYLKPRLARRFGVFSDTFKVTLNGEPITRADAGYYDDIQFLWYFDTDTRDMVTTLAGNIATYADENQQASPCIDRINNTIPFDPASLTLRGFIATVDKPAKLGKKGEESLNRLSIFANGRLFQEDILAELGDARYFNSYLVGEIHADFLDQDDVDRATASREAIRHDDEEFQALRSHLRIVLDTIRDQWDVWRIAQGYENDPDKNPAIEEWIKSFPDKRDQKAANRLMVMISKMKLANDEATEAEAKRMLYRSSVVGFEKLRARHQLDALEAIHDVLSPEFQAIFSTLDDIEESYYIDIVRSRLEVIRKFEEEIVDAKKQEKVAQKYLFDHLWLLDPSWDRVTGSEQWELTLTDELKRACPEAEVGARLDIAYRTTSGRHVIIELKRPGLKVKADDLEAQGRKYVRAVNQYYREHPDLGGMNGRAPAIDVYFLVSSKPDTDQYQEQALAAYNMRFLTYDGLIGNAKMAYQSYLDVQKAVGKIETILQKL